MVTKKNGYKIFFFYTITLSFTFTVCFLLLEFGYARFYYSNYDRIKDKVFDPEIGWLLKPGEYQVKPPHTFLRHTIYINQYGLRSRHNGYEPTAGSKKIMVFGDSFVFGKAVRTEDIFTTRLEIGLNHDTSTDYEVFNGGVPGYGNAQQLLFLKRLGNQGISGDIYPNNEQVKAFFSDIERPNRYIEKICQELDIPFLDLYPILKQLNDQDFYIPREGHLNEKGHALVADSLMEFILDQERDRARLESGKHKG